jgi:EAL domain-containing protein (putative c-di-GMP-specific phosphodiesterase class I)
VGINSDKQSAKIVGAIGQLAERLGMITVAEGIENEDQFRLVQQSNCGFMQGFLFGTPKRAAECIAPNSQ